MSINSEPDFSDLQTGIVHIGVGAFHRAHQAVYTHEVLERFGGDWRIFGVSLRSTEIAHNLNQVGGRYTLAVRNKGALKVQTIKSIAHVASAVENTGEIYKKLADPMTRIVSMTVTEKAYGIVQATHSVDETHHAIQHDLKNPENPTGVIGIIMKGLRDRRASGVPPFTVMCCDNLPQNGNLVRSGVIDFASKSSGQELADWIAENVAFPNSMVDRITPAATTELVREVAETLGITDHMPVETEQFSQWVIEDKFTLGRPRWEAAGVLFVDQVEPYENMKLRMLNGAHSFLAYTGYLSGHRYVRDVMADGKLSALVKKYISAAQNTLEPLEGIELDDYASDLIARFENPDIAHETFQIAMDGSQKLPQRIFAPATDALVAGNSIQMFALATASWIRFCMESTKPNASFELQDPRKTELQTAVQEARGNASRMVEAFLALPDLFPEQLMESKVWKAELMAELDALITT